MIEMCMCLLIRRSIHVYAARTTTTNGVCNTAHTILYVLKGGMSLVLGRKQTLMTVQSLRMATRTLRTDGALGVCRRLRAGLRCWSTVQAVADPCLIAYHSTGPGCLVLIDLRRRRNTPATLCNRMGRNLRTE